MKQQQNRRSGLTLTELLVVIAIIVIVTSVLAPLLTSSLEGREVREAARMVNAYFQQAQAKAKELNRPVGVMIRRSPATDLDRDKDLDFGFQLSLAEVPPPFMGFTSSARIRLEILDSGVPTGLALINDNLPVFRKLVAPNDFIRFNLRGPKYRILRIAGNKLEFDTSDARDVRYAQAATLASNWMKFEVFRRPQSISSTPLELPTGAGIVLNLSGVGMDNATNTGEEDLQDIKNAANVSMRPRQKYIGLTEFQRVASQRFTDMPLTIMFNPSGGVERIYRVLPKPGEEYDNLIGRIPPKRPQDKIYLFMGKQGVDRWTNLDDGSNMWITIDPQSGLVTTAPNAIPLTPVASNPTATLQQKLGAVASSRQLAATGQSMGGQ